MSLDEINERLDMAKHWIGNTLHAKVNNHYGGNMRVLSLDEFLHCKGLYNLVIDNTGFISAMTDPLGKYWMQPHHNQITFRDGYAELNKYCFDLLHEYSSSYPTGAYVGKMWKRQQGNDWYLVWYGHHENPDTLSINYKKIKVVNANFLLYV